MVAFRDSEFREPRLANELLHTLEFRRTLFLWFFSTSKERLMVRATREHGIMAYGWELISDVFHGKCMTSKAMNDIVGDDRLYATILFVLFKEKNIY